MLAELSRSLFLSAAGSSSLRRIVSRYGMRGRNSFARRFIGGETPEEALHILRLLHDAGFRSTLNYLGEHVGAVSEVEKATKAYLELVEQIGLARLPCKLSIKLSQLGLEFDREACTKALDKILTVARLHHGFVRIDMEGSRLVDATLQVLLDLWALGHRHVGIVLQAYLHRTERDLERMIELGIRVRLCKGAYQEPPDVAIQDKPGINAAFARLARRMLQHANAPAFATHDPNMIQAICASAREEAITNDRFEFQMLYGVRRDLQTSLRDQGYGLRVYVPFGHQWFPYFMRRLAERPENVAFVIKSVLYEQLGHTASSR